MKLCKVFVRLMILLYSFFLLGTPTALSFSGLGLFSGLLSRAWEVSFKGSFSSRVRRLSGSWAGFPGLGWGSQRALGGGLGGPVLVLGLGAVGVLDKFGI